jgi:ABC exporter DevB family membrane fusion protein
LLLGLALGIVGTIAFRSDASQGSSAPSSDAAKSGTARRSISALGTLEPRDGIVQVGSALAGYQIKQVHVQDGQRVQAGDILIELDAAPAAAEHALAMAQHAEALERQQAEIEIAKQRVSAAELAVRQAKEGKELEYDAQKSRVSVSGARTKQAAKDLERMEELHKLPTPLTAKQQVEQQQLMLDAAKAEEAAAESALKRVEQSLQFQQQTAEAELRAAQQSLAMAEKGTGIESLKRRLDLTALKLAQTKITAPISGTVLGVQAHAGEVVVQQPLLQLADLENQICIAEVETADVSHLQPNQKAAITSRAFQDYVLEGTINRIANQNAKAVLRPLDPRQPVDRNVTKVIVELDPQQVAKLINLPGSDRRAALVGLQVNVEFPLAK